ncbi:hypothetical protein Javan623_0002 [Streptococcus phage Javan623]|uniref:hypothetical protein n=1 Tax=Streptococcus uberis TaxID=1349 RepID=UPI00062031F6|nr:hypothetical protein [Streptococcus uberis]KKF55640.1 hypothetical protein AF66_02505 [Streptococcus uberis B190]QBX21949.1 hypothetical protein Javan623_0002 [Streptococcus phage Javan623]
MFAQLLAFLFLVSCYLTWYFIKKKPNKKNRNRSIIALLALFILIGITAPKQEEKKIETKPKVESVAKTKDKKEEKKKTSKYDEKANKNFAMYLTAYINNQFLEKNIDEQVSVDYYKNSAIYLRVKQDYKYFEDNQKQKSVDSMLSIKNKLFKDFASEKGFDFSEDNPTMYVVVEDGTQIASESVLQKTMKLDK